MESNTQVFNWRKAEEAIVWDLYREAELKKFRTPKPNSSDNYENSPWYYRMFRAVFDCNQQTRYVITGSDNEPFLLFRKYIIWFQRSYLRIDDNKIVDPVAFHHFFMKKVRSIAVFVLAVNVTFLVVFIVACYSKRWSHSELSMNHPVFIAIRGYLRVWLVCNFLCLFHFVVLMDIPKRKLQYWDINMEDNWKYFGYFILFLWIATACQDTATYINNISTLSCYGLQDMGTEKTMAFWYIFTCTMQDCVQSLALSCMPFPWPWGAIFASIMFYQIAMRISTCSEYVDVPEHVKPRIIEGFIVFVLIYLVVNVSLVSYTFQRSILSSYSNTASQSDIGKNTRAMVDLLCTDVKLNIRQVLKTLDTIMHFTPAHISSFQTMTTDIRESSMAVHVAVDHLIFLAKLGEGRFEFSMMDKIHLNSAIVEVCKDYTRKVKVDHREVCIHMEMPQEIVRTDIRCLHTLVYYGLMAVDTLVLSLEATKYTCDSKIRHISIPQYVLRGNIEQAKAPSQPDIVALRITITFDVCNTILPNNADKKDDDSVKKRIRNLVESNPLIHSCCVVCNRLIQTYGGEFEFSINHLTFTLPIFVNPTSVQQQQSHRMSYANSLSSFSVNASLHGTSRSRDENNSQSMLSPAGLIPLDQLLREQTSLYLTVNNMESLVIDALQSLVSLTSSSTATATTTSPLLPQIQQNMMVMMNSDSKQTNLQRSTSPSNIINNGGATSSTSIRHAQHHPVPIQRVLNPIDLKIRAIMFVQSIQARQEVIQAGFSGMIILCSEKVSYLDAQERALFAYIVPLPPSHEDLHLLHRFLSRTLQTAHWKKYGHNVNSTGNSTSSALFSAKTQQQHSIFANRRKSKIFPEFSSSSSSSLDPTPRLLNTPQYTNPNDNNTTNNSINNAKDEFVLLCPIRLAPPPRSSLLSRLLNFGVYSIPDHQHANYAKWRFMNPGGDIYHHTTNVEFFSIFIAILLLYELVNQLATPRFVAVSIPLACSLLWRKSIYYLLSSLMSFSNYWLCLSVISGGLSIVVTISTIISIHTKQLQYTSVHDVLTNPAFIETMVNNGIEVIFNLVSFPITLKYFGDYLTWPVSLLTMAAQVSRSFFFVGYLFAKVLQGFAQRIVMAMFVHMYVIIFLNVISTEALYRDEFLQLYDLILARDYLEKCLVLARQLIQPMQTVQVAQTQILEKVVTEAMAGQVFLHEQFLSATKEVQYNRLFTEELIYTLQHTHNPSLSAKANLSSLITPQTSSVELLYEEQRSRIINSMRVLLLPISVQDILQCFVQECHNLDISLYHRIAPEIMHIRMSLPLLRATLSQVLRQAIQDIQEHAQQARRHQWSENRRYNQTAKNQNGVYAAKTDKDLYEVVAEKEDIPSCSYKNERRMHWRKQLHIRPQLFLWIYPYHLSVQAETGRAYRFTDIRDLEILVLSTADNRYLDDNNNHDNNTPKYNLSSSVFLPDLDSTILGRSVTLQKSQTSSQGKRIAADYYADYFGFTNPDKVYPVHDFSASAKVNKQNRNKIHTRKYHDSGRRRVNYETGHVLHHNHYHSYQRVLLPYLLTPSSLTFADLTNNTRPISNKIQKLDSSSTQYYPVYFRAASQYFVTAIMNSIRQTYNNDDENDNYFHGNRSTYDRESIIQHADFLLKSAHSNNNNSNAFFTTPASQAAISGYSVAYTTAITNYYQTHQPRLFSSSHQCSTKMTVSDDVGNKNSNTNSDITADNTADADYRKPIVAPTIVHPKTPSLTCRSAGMHVALILSFPDTGFTRYHAVNNQVMLGALGWLGRLETMRPPAMPNLLHYNTKTMNKISTNNSNTSANSNYSSSSNNHSSSSSRAYFSMMDVECVFIEYMSTHADYHTANNSYHGNSKNSGNSNSFSTVNYGADKYFEGESVEARLLAGQSYLRMIVQYLRFLGYEGVIVWLGPESMTVAMQNDSDIDDTSSEKNHSAEKNRVAVYDSENNAVADDLPQQWMHRQSVRADRYLTIPLQTHNSLQSLLPECERRIVELALGVWRP